jgi:hypothetical protein
VLVGCEKDFNNISILKSINTSPWHENIIHQDVEPIGITKQCHKNINEAEI